MTNIPQTDVLVDDAALAEIEARNKKSPDMVSVCGEYHCDCHGDIPALIATIRSLRATVRICEQAFELEEATRHPEVGNLNMLQVAKQLAAANDFRDKVVELIEARSREWDGEDTEAMQQAKRTLCAELAKQIKEMGQ